jgi:hypothetical protein
MRNRTVFEIFPAGGRVDDSTEYWRFFRPGTTDEHLVASTDGIAWE